MLGLAPTPGLRPRSVRGPRGGHGGGRRPAPLLSPPRAEGSPLRLRLLAWPLSRVPWALQGPWKLGWSALQPLPLPGVSFPALMLAVQLSPRLRSPCPPLAPLWHVCQGVGVRGLPQPPCSHLNLVETDIPESVAIR